MCNISISFDNKTTNNIYVFDFNHFAESMTTVHFYKTIIFVHMTSQLKYENMIIILLQRSANR